MAEYLGSRAAGTGTYARERLPELIKQFRENGRNAGAHIEPVEATVVEGFRDVLLATDDHVAHWVEL